MSEHYNKIKLEQRDDGIYYCLGEHILSDTCDWDKVSITLLDALQENMSQLESRLAATTAALEAMTERERLTRIQRDDARTALTAAVDEGRELRVELASAQTESRTRMLALESLTPGGSEFVGDVTACVAHVRARQASMLNSIKNATKRAQTAEASLDRLCELAKGMRAEGDGDMVATFERVIAESKKDYADMRRFQGDVIRLTHELGKADEAIKTHVQRVAVAREERDDALKLAEDRAASVGQAVAWMVRFNKTECCLYDDERRARMAAGNLTENGWLDVVIIPLVALGAEGDGDGR